MKIFIESCWPYMTNRIKSGFGTYEMLTVCVMLLVIVVGLLAYVFSTDYTEKYDVMQYNARMFSLTASNLYMDENYSGKMGDTVYYLQMILDLKLTSQIKNPFQGDKYCDSYRSKVEIRDDKKYVTLECGNYLIYQQDSLKEPYTIYQVSNWSNVQSGFTNQIVDFYNYKKDGIDLFDEDLELGMFLYKYNFEMGTDYQKIDEIPDQENIVKTTRYRHLKEVTD